MGEAAGVQPSASQSSSFAFSRAGLAVKPGVQSCPEEPEAAQNAHVHPLGFFAAEGARQLCHVEGDHCAPYLGSLPFVLHSCVHGHRILGAHPGGTPPRALLQSKHKGTAWQHYREACVVAANVFARADYILLQG